MKMLIFIEHWQTLATTPILLTTFKSKLIARQVFSDLDLTGDGFVTAQDVHAVLNHLHTPFSRHLAGSTGKQLDQWIADRDQDGDGDWAYNWMYR